MRCVRWIIGAPVCAAVRSHHEAIIVQRGNSAIHQNCSVYLRDPTSEIDLFFSLCCVEMHRTVGFAGLAVEAVILVDILSIYALFLMVE